MKVVRLDLTDEEIAALTKLAKAEHGSVSNYTSAVIKKHIKQLTLL